MSIIHNPQMREFSLALFLSQDAGRKAAPYIKELAETKETVIKALGALIIQAVASHGLLCESHDKKYWYRMMACTDIPDMPGFREVIAATFGDLDWFDLYRPALLNLDRTKAHFSTGMGDCFVILTEKLSLSAAETIRAARLSPPPTP